MQNAFCLPQCTGEVEKQNWSKRRIYLTRWLYRERVLKSLIFKFLAQFTPKQILNCSCRKTFHKRYSPRSSQAHTHPHSPPPFSLPSSFPPQMKHSGQFAVILLLLSKVATRRVKPLAGKTLEPTHKDLRAARYHTEP